jgi:hypothetical protein
MIEALIYHKSGAFNQGVKGFIAVDRAMTNGTANFGGWPFSLIFYIWPLIVIYSYLTKLDSTFESQLTIFKVALISLVPVYSLIIWHPQWLIFIVPFILLLVTNAERLDFFIFLDAIFSFLFFSLTFKNFQGNVDYPLFDLSILKFFNPASSEPSNAIAFTNIGFYRFGSSSVLLGFFNAILFSYCIFLKKDNLVKDFELDPDTHCLNSALKMTRIRFYVVMLIFILSSLYSYIGASFFLVEI